MGGNDEAVAKKRRTKRIKTMCLTADGKWEEEEESVECSDADTNEGSPSPELKKETAVDRWRPEGLINFDYDDSSDEEIVPWGWVKSASGAKVAEEEKTDDPMTGDDSKPMPEQQPLFDEEEHDPVGAAIAESVAEIMQEPAPPHIKEEPEELAVEETSEKDKQLSSYVPGSFLALLMKQDDALSEASGESDAEEEERLPAGDRRFGMLRRTTIMSSRSRSRSPRRREELSAATATRPSEWTPGYGLRGRLRATAAADERSRMPRMRGSITLSMPVNGQAGSTDDEEGPSETHAAVSSSAPVPSAAARSENSETAADDIIPDELLTLDSLALGRVFMNAIPKVKLCSEEEEAMQVLARHVARLGAAGPALETAVFTAARKGINYGGSVAAAWNRWHFVTRSEGMQAYLLERCKLSQIYQKHAANLDKCDVEVRKWLPSVASAAPTSHEEEPPPPVILGGDYSGMVNLAIPSIRFAHHCQRELFGHLSAAHNCTVKRSILQLAVEFVVGLTQPADVPTFRVCLYNGQWYCHSGNRRLAAFQMAHAFAPERFGRLVVPMASADEAFLQGKANHMPKLTTARNGEDCLGRWMFIRETGEAVRQVGQALPPKCTGEYGHDLLSLLPRMEVSDPPPPPPQSARETVRQTPVSAQRSRASERVDEWAPSQTTVSDARVEASLPNSMIGKAPPLKCKVEYDHDSSLPPHMETQEFPPPKAKPELPPPKAKPARKPAPPSMPPPASLIQRVREGSAAGAASSGVAAAASSAALAASPLMPRKAAPPSTPPPAELIQRVRGSAAASAAALGVPASAPPPPPPQSAPLPPPPAAPPLPPPPRFEPDVYLDSSKQSGGVWRVPADGIAAV
eukprot:TRINITY_DN38986_c0_g1_i1.p1 TRINITY_DN38986_c0_g1~~TRINITY_DN38986_c0_g1_i1.p1  ORF type:complete len:881 (-),score=219.37 TRINITY_DN38986_c0_g1_i1:254-2830(-)